MAEWVYVPKEPTKEMIKAGENWSGLPSATWTDMLDAVEDPDEDQMASFVQEAYDQGFRDGIAKATEALSLVISYDDLMRQFTCPISEISGAENAAIDYSYDRMVRAARDLAGVPSS